MRIQIKTEFWNEKNLNVWRKRYERITISYIIFILANMGYHLFLKNTFFVIINLFPFLLGIIIMISYNKRGEEAR